MPTVPGAMSRYAGCAPSITNTGRPDTVKATAPSVSSAPLTGAVDTMLLPGLSGDVGSDTDWGAPKRTVPRTTTSDERVRSSTGTAISDAFGGAVRAAISAGDWIWRPANHPMPDATMTAASPMPRVVCRRIDQRRLPDAARRPGARRAGASTHGHVLAAIVSNVGTRH